MRITRFERSEFCSIGLVAGEGVQFKFLAMNATGRIEYLLEFVDGEWQVVTGPPPMFLQTLVAAKCADEMWKHNEGPATPTVIIGAEP